VFDNEKDKMRLIEIIPRLLKIRKSELLQNYKKDYYVSKRLDTVKLYDALTKKLKS
jgi:hypothetical protein